MADQAHGREVPAERTAGPINSEQLGPALRYAAWGIAGLSAATASLLAAPGLSGALGAALAVIMIAIAAIDARHFIIPDQLVLAGLIVGLLAAAFDQPNQIASHLEAAMLRGALMAMCFFGFRALYRHIRGRQGIGLGDVKLAGVAGVWLGWTALALAIDVAALTALGAVLISAFRGQKFSAVTRVPFGLFFAPAIWLGWLLDTAIVRQIF